MRIFSFGTAGQLIWHPEELTPIFIWVPDEQSHELLPSPYDWLRSHSTSARHHAYMPGEFQRHAHTCLLIQHILFTISLSLDSTGSYLPVLSSSQVCIIYLKGCVLNSCPPVIIWHAAEWVNAQPSQPKAWCRNCGRNFVIMSTLLSACLNDIEHHACMPEVRTCGWVLSEQTAA